ncbi:MAG: SDR family NAD(P)-dependent oxidoreductase, partial [Mariniphaga sp.]|nr:SDR family NAD(P)-dependent oxidoreductase [Mariniphaga sp.]
MNNTALITGASKRIGRSVAEHLAAKGWNVILHFNTSEKPASELVSKLANKFPKQNFQTIKANLSISDEVETLIKRAVNMYGKFDLLINNASVFDPGHISETNSVLLNSQLDVNLKAPFILMRDFKKYCGSGNIINFVDTRIKTNKSNFTAYSLSKKALWELTKMAALEFAPDIRVNAIAPGVTLAPTDRDESYLNNLAKQIPMQKPGGVEPIFKSLDYILENDHLTGQLLFADGGENLGKN